MRRFAIVASLLAVLLVQSLPAWATKPVRERLPNADAVIEGVCDFAVDIHVLVDNEYITTFFDNDGNPTHANINGHLVVRLTNLDTGDSVDRNISGPGTLYFGETVVLKATGAWMFIFLPDMLGEGSPPMFIINHGQFWLDFGEEFQTILLQTGHQEDVCATLA
jgi:hypothetical protein